MIMNFVAFSGIIFQRHSGYVFTIPASGNTLARDGEHVSKWSECNCTDMIRSSCKFGVKSWLTRSLKGHCQLCAIAKSISKESLIKGIASIFVTAK